MSTTTESSELRRALTHLTQRLEAIEARLNGAAMPESIDLPGRLADVSQITRELFPGKCEFTSEFDPEYPDDRYVVVSVEATGDPRNIVDRSCEWHQRVRNLSADLERRLRLAVVPV
jgi:hypothetical protein